MEKQPERKPDREQEIDVEFELVDEAFLLKPDDQLALEKKILAVAFLLEACTYEGNGQVEGTAACGFADILRDCARDVSGLRHRIRRQEGS